MPNEGRNRGQLSAAGQPALVAATHFALGAGWGASTIVLGTGANDVAGNFTITAATGGGLAQATATITITYAKPYATAPRAVLVTVTDDSAIDEGHCTWSSTTTALTLTFSVLPVNTKIYKFTYAAVA
jgi:hypothetical protein